METRTYKVYKFNELPDKAKQKTLENYHDINVDYEWYDSEKEYWTDKLEKLGYTDIKIYFTGFYSQGDGACFTARIELAEWLRAHKLVKKFPNAFKGAYDLSYFKIEHTTNHYYYSTSTDVSYEINSYNQIGNEKLEKELEAICALIEAEREKIGNLIYKDLQNEYEARTTFEAVAETLEINDYDFTLCGKIDNQCI